MTENVLQHHDSRIEHHSGGESEPGERDDIQCAARGIQHHEADEQAQRNGQSNDHGGAELTQEPPQHGDRKRYAKHQVVAHHPDRGGNVNGVVAVLKYTQPRLIEFIGRQVSHRGLETIHDLVDVDARLGDDVDGDRGPAILVQHIGRIHHRHLDAGNVLEQNGLAGAPVQHQVPE